MFLLTNDRAKDRKSIYEFLASQKSMLNFYIQILYLYLNIMNRFSFGKKH